MRRLLLALLALTFTLSTMPAEAQVMPWRGFVLVEISPSITERLSNDMETRLREAFGALAPTAGEWPPYILQVRLNLARTAACVEARWYAEPTSIEIASVIADRVGLAPVVVADGIEVTVFGTGGTFKDSLQGWVAYLRANLPEWEQPR